jgi:hypothetical protein
MGAKNATPNTLTPAAKEVSHAKMRDTLVRGLAIPTLDPKQLLPEAYDQLINHKGSPKTEKEKAALMEQVVFTLGFENDYTLVETVNEKYRGMAIELRRQLIKDFDCKTYAEKVLVDSVVSGYMRTIQCAKSFNNISHDDYLSGYKNQYMATMSKELDRAQRQLMAAYQMLVNLKRPPLTVQVKAKTAFVAQNQQLNMTQPDDKGQTVNEAV